ncbi:hypothetical protein BCR33DRAFT_301163 [Rhizoclosmatium globosum]|uniref:Uncharacterized protein n=1 Tax=Rhizoclosmatium globosum TaxID=329046 RepID=A0A1Y2C6G7_9FUNG|nr:hypothetical protein BCR33DRAFT_301163 [Rhizoclosmatium globosum]|eukprot:ORY42633.1 hypothetical protein BCR33DRAFT_301163 [Rhizoclosmatium globosum]
MDETKQLFLFSERNQPFTRLRTTYHWLRTPDEDDFNSFFGMFWRMYLYFRNSEPPSHTFTASNLLPFFSLSKLKKEGLKIMKPSLCFLCSVSMPPQDQTCCLVCGRCFHVNCASSHNCNQPLTSSTNPSLTNLLTNDPRMYTKKFRPSISRPEYPSQNVLNSFFNFSVRIRLLLCSLCTRKWFATITISISSRSLTCRYCHRRITVPPQRIQFYRSINLMRRKITHRMDTSSSGLQKSAQSSSNRIKMDRGIVPSASFVTCSWTLIS